MAFTNFLQGITWKDGLWAVLAAILIFLNVRSCNTSKDLLQISSSSCDTVLITHIDSFIEWRDVPIPFPVIDTVEKLVFVERIVEIIRTDTITITNFTPTFAFTLDSVPLFVYDSIFETRNYKLRWHIESLGELQVFQHALNFKYEVRQTNNLQNFVDDRKFMLSLGSVAQVNFSAPSRTVFYFGGDIYREWRRFAVGAGYYNQIGGNDFHLFKVNAGIRF